MGNSHKNLLVWNQLLNWNQTSKIVGTFYMQGYKVKEKTAIVPPVSKLSGHPDATHVI
jgi:hypothetical protein